MESKSIQVMITRRNICKAFGFFDVYMNQFESYKNSYKKETNLLKLLNIGVFIKNTHMWGNGL